MVAGCQSDQLSAQDWLDQGLKARAANGAGALKAEVASESHGRVARQLLLALRRYRRVPHRDPGPLARGLAERVIADLEVAAEHENPLLLLLRRTFYSRLTLEKAVRSWATFDAEARTAVQAIDRRRMDYIEGVVSKASGLAEDVAQARAQILYWAFVGYALSDKPLPKAKQEAVYHELVRIAVGN